MYPTRQETAFFTHAIFQVGGYNGPDYWKDLIETGKKSQYYKPSVLFHAGSQAARTDLTKSICADVPNTDRVAIAPYMVGTFSKEAEQTLDSDDKLFRWAFGYSLQRAVSEGSTLNQTYQAAKQAKIELSVYEFNYHTTSGGGSLETRNRMITSLAGGVNVANTMLLMLKKQGIRVQNVYSLAQYGYRLQAGRAPGGRESTPEGLVRVWGTALNMRKGKERYRPSFLACSLANKVMGGDLIETVHSGANPTFQGIGKSELGERQGAGNANLDAFKGDCIWSYAFSDGKKCGLILVNLDLKESLPVELKFQGKSKGQAKCWTMAADKPSASNEFANDSPQVKIAESTVQIDSGGKLTLPPCSMQAFAWEVE
ncbi:MAG: hypothetical protein HZA50_14035 [Planctomycetes bacterium]|nr:hypothetical protein [Planctomycetota bacterium]